MPPGAVASAPGQEVEGCSLFERSCSHRATITSSSWGRYPAEKCPIARATCSPLPRSGPPALGSRALEPGGVPAQPLAVGAVVAGAVHELLSHDAGAAARTRTVGLSVGIQRTVEIARLHDFVALTWPMSAGMCRSSFTSYRSSNITPSPSRPATTSNPREP